MRSPVSVPKGFTLIELLVVIAVIAILAALLLSATSRATAKAHRVKCASNLKQLSLAQLMYADDFNDELPPRSLAGTWISGLKSYYVASAVLICPSDSGQRRSYMINGYDDWFEANLDTLQFLGFMDWEWPRGMQLSAISEAAETIAFGEKKTSSAHVHVDILQGGGNEIQEVEQTSHFGKGSNFAFVDGSVRFLLAGESITPQNLWATTATWRH